jgi:hypothetical protein
MATSNKQILTTQDLRDDVLQIRQDLREGKITNAIARTLIHSAKVALDSVMIEMRAKQLGSGFEAVHLHESERMSAATAH